MKALKAIGATAALFPAADVIIKAIPVPADFELLFKIGTPLICVLLLWFAVRPQSKEWAMWLAFGGCAFLIAYLFLASFSLHSSPQYYTEGDNSVIGLWPTKYGHALIERAGGDRNLAFRDIGPEEWLGVYSRTSQAATVIFLFAAYAGAFSCLSVGMVRIGSE